MPSPLRSRLSLFALTLPAAALLGAGVGGWSAGRASERVVAGAGSGSWGMAPMAASIIGAVLVIAAVGLLALRGGLQAMAVSTACGVSFGVYGLGLAVGWWMGL